MTPILNEENDVSHEEVNQVEVKSLKVERVLFKMLGYYKKQKSY